MLFLATADVITRYNQSYIGLHCSVNILGCGFRLWCPNLRSGQWMQFVALAAVLLLRLDIELESLESVSFRLPCWIKLTATAASCRAGAEVTSKLDSVCVCDYRPVLLWYRSFCVLSDSELEQIKTLFNEKEKELSLAVAKVSARALWSVVFWFQIRIE